MRTKIKAWWSRRAWYTKTLVIAGLLWPFWVPTLLLTTEGRQRETHRSTHRESTAELLGVEPGKRMPVGGVGFKFATDAQAAARMLAKDNWDGVEALMDGCGENAMWMPKGAKGDVLRVYNEVAQVQVKGKRWWVPVIFLGE